MLRINCFLKHVTEGKTKGTEREEDVSSYWMNLRKQKIPGIKRRSIISHCNSLWKRLWTYRKTDYVMMNSPEKEFPYHLFNISK